MKKLLALLCALPLLIGMAACDDDGDLPQVDINFNFSNAIVSDGTVYVVSPDTLVVEGITVKPTRPNHVATCVGPVNYWLNGVPVYTTFVAPFGVEIPTEDLTPGAYTLTANMGIAEEGATLATAVTQVKIVVVTDQTEIPQPDGDSSNLPVTHKFE